MTRFHPTLLYLTIAVVSTCGIAVELLAGAAATSLLGEGSTQFALVIGVHLTAMGAGAWLTRHVEEHLARRFLECQLAIALVGGLSVPCLFAAYAHTFAVREVLFLLVALVGVLVGAAFPLLLRVLRRHRSLRDLVARALSVDYAGGLIGALLVGILLLPRLGMMRTGLLFGLLSALSALWGATVLVRGAVFAFGLRLRALAVTAVLVAATIASQRLTRATDEASFADAVVLARQTAYQRIVITRGHGGINLFLDGNLQFASLDEYRYHEALVHPALAVAPRRAHVLVLGGGDGLAVRELLRYPDVEDVTLVDLDDAMTDLARSFAPLRTLNAAALSSPRVRVINDDAMVWLADVPSGPWDVAVVDFPDPNNYAVGKLYTTRFYALLRQRLAADAVVVVQSTSPLAARRSFWCVVTTLEAAGFQTLPYHAPVPTFGEWGWVLASPRALAAPSHVLGGLRYLDDGMLRGLFTFAPDMARVDAEVNRLNDQSLVRYYDADWQRWLH
ncbi:MAG: polyamine aminopropyltransferase [Polyangiales bacterium]